MKAKSEFNLRENQNLLDSDFENISDCLLSFQISFLLTM